MQGGGLEPARVGGNLGAVAVDVVGGALGGVAGSEVGAVAAEDLDPLRAGLVELSATRWAVLWWRPRVMAT